MAEKQPGEALIDALASYLKPVISGIIDGAIESFLADSGPASDRGSRPATGRDQESTPEKGLRIDHPPIGREQDLEHALEGLLKHYRRHTAHRCEIDSNAEHVLHGMPSMRFDAPGDTIFEDAASPPPNAWLQWLKESDRQQSTTLPNYLCGYESLPDEPGRFCRRLKGHKMGHSEYPTVEERSAIDGLADSGIPLGMAHPHYVRLYPTDDPASQRLGCGTCGSDWPCQYASGWAKGWGDREARVPVKQLEQLAFILDVLRVFEKADAYGDLFWRFYDGKLVLLMNCNDVFDGASDAEPIVPETLDLLVKTWEDLAGLDLTEAVWMDHSRVGHLPTTRHASSYFSALYAARSRGERPWQVFYGPLNATLTKMFNECGPAK